MDDTINNMIDRIQVQDFANAQPMFAELMASKLSDMIDAEKIKVAGQIFNGQQDPEFTDEILDEIIDEDEVDVD